MKLLMIDNYDSFTYNIVQYFGELGAEVEVFRNDEITIEGVAARARPPGDLARPLLSAAEAGISVAAIQHFAGQAAHPGRAWGTRALARPLAARSSRAAAHARQDQRHHHHAKGRVRWLLPAVHGEPLPLAGHRARELPEVLEITAWTEDGEIMGVRHRELAIEGVQFHPESILTEHGHAMLRNFLSSGREHRDAPAAHVHRCGLAVQPHARAGRALHRLERAALWHARGHRGRLGITAGCFVHIFAAAVGVGAVGHLGHGVHRAQVAGRPTCCGWGAHAVLARRGRQWRRHRRRAGRHGNRHRCAPCSWAGSGPMCSTQGRHLFLAFVPQFIAPATRTRPWPSCCGVLFNVNAIP